MTNTAHYSNRKSCVIYYFCCLFELKNGNRSSSQVTTRPLVS